MAPPRLDQRYFYPDGRLQAAIPMHVVSDTGDTVAGWTTPGSQISYWSTPSGADPRTIPLSSRFTGVLTTARRTWTGGGMLRVVPVNERWQVLHFWDTQTGAFLGWYVNLESAKTRRRSSIDAIDWHLDLLISPDLAVTWKDEDEAAAAAGTPYLRSEDFRSARETGETIAADPQRVLDRIGDWRSFTPARHWEPLALRDDHP